MVVQPYKPHGLRQDRGPLAPPVSGFNYYSTSHPQGGKSLHELNDLLYLVDSRESRDRRMRSAVITSARLLDGEARLHGHRSRSAFLTLTYAGVDDWRPNHLASFTHCVRQWCKRRRIPFRYVFKAELQSRGAVHYHFIIWLPKGISLPKPDKVGWWKHGHTSIKWAKNAVGYLAKYCAKAQSERPFPRGLRFHGAGGFSKQSTIERRWWSMPSWVRSKAGIQDQPFRYPGGGITLRATGEWLESPYQVVSTDRGKIVIMRKEDLH